MTFVQHLDELRTRLLRSIWALLLGVTGAMFFYRDLVKIATVPHFRALSWLPHPPLISKFIAESHLGGVGAVMKLACIVGLFVASPYIARELWGFVAAGLYRDEKRYIRAFAPVSFLLFLLGCVFGYFILIPYSLYAMTTTMPLEQVEPIFSFGEYLSLFLNLTLLLGLVFQLPLLMVFGAKIGLLTSAQYRSWRKHAVVANILGAAILAPPDLLSMLVFVLPLVLLYEIGILASALALRLR